MAGCLQTCLIDGPGIVFGQRLDFSLLILKVRWFAAPHPFEREPNSSALAAYIVVRVPGDGIGSELAEAD